MSTKAGKKTTPVREALLLAARLEFAEQGYVGATTREIARRAGVSEVMVFRHFGSKSNLFKEAVFQPLDRNMVELKDNVTKDNSGGHMSSATWRKYSQDLLRSLEENKTLFIALITASASEKSQTLNVSDLTSLDEYFAHATEAMDFSMTDADRARLGNPAIIVRLTFSLVATLALFKDWLYPERLMPLDEVVEAMTRFAERALGMEPDEPERDPQAPPLTG